MSGYDEHNHRPDEQTPIPGAAIILEGWFNPGIIHPRWFLMHDILNEAETEWAESRDEGSAPRTGIDFSEFEAPGFLFTCLRPRLRVASTVGAHDFERLAEVIHQTLDNLPHMPARALSMTRSLHLPAGADEWRQLAGFLVPDERAEAVLEDSSLASVTLRQQLGDNHRLEVTLEESQRVRGTFVSVIERLDFPADGTDLGNDRAREAIASRWTNLLASAEKIIAEVPEFT